MVLDTSSMTTRQLRCFTSPKTVRTRVRQAVHMCAASHPPIMVNSCTGKMGHATAEAVVRAGIELVPFTFCGHSTGVAVGNVGISGIPVERVTPEKRAQVMTDVKAKYPGLVIIDYTLPSAVMDNAAFYCHHKVPFVMGTTGGDRAKLVHSSDRLIGSFGFFQCCWELDGSVISAVLTRSIHVDIKHQWTMVMSEDHMHSDIAAIRMLMKQMPFSMSDTEASGVHAVIAPQMGKQVVAFQAMMENMAENFPGAFTGYTLEVLESHQRTKADTSGTAKAIVESFQRMGLDFDVNQIQKIRDPSEQQDKMHVPVKYIDGHAFHTYRLKSADGTVGFEFQHNVCGRTIYAEGTVDAALFLHRMIQEKSEKTLFNMIDVLRAGSMR